MDLRESIGHQTAFALCLTRFLSSGADERNVAFSPLSIHVALSLTAAGAKGNTLDQMVSALVGPEGRAADLGALADHTVGLVLADGSALGGPRVCCTNGVFVDASLSLKPSFEKVITGTYQSEAKAVDFRTKADAVANEINSWVEKATTGVIKELLPPNFVDSDTRLVLVNALYFKCAWDEEFDPSATHDSEFHLLNGTTIQVPCMTITRSRFLFLSSYEGFKVLKLPYKQHGDVRRQFSMYIFLPDARDGIWSLQEKISSEPEFLSRHLPTTTDKVGMFKLPKFKISFGFEASAILKDLGMVSPFSATDADFSEMVEPMSNRLFVSKMLHKSFIAVNEGGTEAATSTAVKMLLGSALSLTPAVDFVADHPFIFFIREDMTGAMLFAGHVKNPLN